MSDSNTFADISRRTIDPDGREDVEKQMEMIYNGNDYTASILPSIMADGRVMPIRQAAVICLKKNLRNLVKEASSLFANIQSLILDECCMVGNEPLTRDIVLKNSRCYRAVIESNMNTTDCMETKKMLHQINILWNLVEILYIDVLPAGNLVEQLLIWIRYHYPNTNLEADAMLKNNEVHEHPSYWTIILKFVVRGEIKMASKLLKLHPDCETNENLSFIHILMEKMPQFTRNCMKYEFFAKWQAWNMQVKTHFRKSVFTSPEERTILGLMCGDFGTFSSNKHLFESWYHLMVAFLHFADPLVAEIDIPSLAFQSLTTYLDIRSEEQAKPYDRAILKAFAYDLMAVVQESCSAFKDGWWFCTHFIDLLYHGGILEGIEEPRKLREFFILDYADVLMGDDELWPNAVNYYASCSEFGLESLRLHLESKPLDTEETKSKIIQICEKHNLDDVIRVVYIVIARKALTENNLGQALIMAARSKSPVLASHIADIYLQHFVEKKKFPDQKALDSLGPLMLTCDKLTFLAKYNEFLECKKRGSLLEAGVQLENLISSKIAPNFFIFTLLMDAVSLLEAEMLILNFEQTYQVLVALENFANMMNDQTKDEDVKNKENYLRLAIARNMARAMIFA